MPNFGYHFARAQGAALRKVYSAALPIIARRPLTPPRNLPFVVYAYSGENVLPEQVASIRSFLRYAGRPEKFFIVSDGTYSLRSLELLQTIDPSVAIAESAPPASFPADSRPYLSQHPTGKQIALIMSLPVAGPALYLDSDVLFFPGASALAAIDRQQNHYLADCRLSADERLFREPAERAQPVNTGVLFLSRKMDWSLGWERFRALDGPPNFFTNQTMTHLTMHANGALPFDPQTFVLQLDDQFVYPDRYARPHLVLRHYVNPVRHKFWTALCR